MSYTKQTWADGEAGGTPFTAARGSHIEDGIAAVDAGLDAAKVSLAADIAALQTSVGTKVATTDPRLSDARTPLTHAHAKAEVGLSNVDNTSDATKPVSTAVAAELAGKQDSATLSAAVRAVMPALRTVTAAVTLALSDDVVRVDSASAVTVTVPANASVAFPVGSVVQVRRRGAGTVTVAASGGVTINGVLTGAPQYGSYALLKVAANEWDIEGGQ